MRFFTSDLHLFHKTVIDFCNRPFSDLDEMHEQITRRWNIVTDYNPKADTYVLGDFSFGKKKETEQFINGLSGRIHLVKGNHDKECHRRYIDMGFDSVVDWSVIKIGDYKPAFLSHFPYKGYELDDRKLSNQLEFRKDWLLHGHVHNAWKVKNKMINVGVDQWAYAPVTEQDILDIMLSREGK